jgi:hypothetical protein
MAPLGTEHNFHAYTTSGCKKLCQSGSHSIKGLLLKKYFRN